MGHAGRRRARRTYMTAMAVEIALAPLVILVGEPLRHRYLRPGRPDRRSVVARSHLDAIALNPVASVLTAPGRWVGHVVRRRANLRGVWRAWRGGGGPPLAGVREPRRPKPTPPADVVSLTEPRR